VRALGRSRRARRVRLRAAHDGLRAEREQGITIDVAYRYFATGARSFVLATAPHVQYTRNMVTGATTADAVVVLIDARKGVLEQTRRHLAVVALLRVPHVVVAVNKIDLLDFAEDRYTPVAAQVSAVAAELGIAHIYVLPVSALEGDNIVERSARTPGTKARPARAARDPAGTGRARDALRLPPAGAAGAATAGRPGPRARRGPRGRRALSRPPLVRGADLVGLDPGRRPRDRLPRGVETTVTAIDIAGAPGEEAVAPSRCRCSSPTTWTPRAAPSSPPPEHFRMPRARSTPSSSSSTPAS
jgi:sulfate adenylyltransferase subunit 1